jgi:hypothetical protein
MPAWTGFSFFSMVTFKTSYFAFYGIVYCIVVNIPYFCIVGIAITTTKTDIKKKIKAHLP